MVHPGVRLIVTAGSRLISGVSKLNLPREAAIPSGSRIIPLGVMFFFFVLQSSWGESYPTQDPLGEAG